MNSGTVLGGLSLAIQLASSCLKGKNLSAITRILILNISVGYEVITSTLKALEDSNCLSLQFEIEQSRLRDFIQAAGLADGASKDGTNRTLLAKTTVLLNVLSGIKLTLTRYANDEECQDGPPSETMSPTISSDLSEGYGSLSSKLSTSLRKAPESMGLVRSFTWSIFRKSDSEKVLARLGRYNDFLHELLDTQQLRNLRDHQQQKYMELVQMRNSLDDIQKLTEAAHASKTVHSWASTWQHAIDEELENLAGFKTLYTSLLRNNSSHVGDIRVASSKIRLASKASEQDRYGSLEAIRNSQLTIDTGGMPTLKKTKIPLRMQPTSWLTPVSGKDVIFLPFDIPPGGTKTTTHEIWAKIKSPRAQPDSTAFKEVSTIKLEATIPDLDRHVPHFEYSQNITIQYPVKLVSDEFKWMDTIPQGFSTSLQWVVCAGELY